MDSMKKTLEHFPIATLLIGALVLTGCLDVLLDGDLSTGFRDLLNVLDVPLAGLAVGRGVMAAKR